MHIRRKRAVLALSITSALFVAACSDDSSSSSTTAPGSATTAAGATTAAASTPESTSVTTGGSTETSTGGTSDGTGGAGGDVSLADICPSTVSIQTDWNPEGEHGFLYNLLGDDYSIDTGKVSVTGTLRASDGSDTGVKVEVRSGGPAIGFATVTSQLYQDDSILLGYVYTDEGIQNSDTFPTVAIESGFEKNPQMIMWDPATYPDVKTIADLGKTDATVRYFSGAAYMDYFTSKGILPKANVDGSYDGKPASFIAADGKDAQQGFGSAEPYIYENEIPDWGKPVAYQYINDAGWTNYAESIATKPDNIDKYKDCFTKLVPMIQQSSVDYVKDPARANKIILDAVKKFNNGWVYSQGVADYAVKTMVDDKLVSDGADGIHGNFDLDRVNELIQKAIPVYTALDSPPKAGLKAEDMVTNEFIDESISLGS